MPRNGQDVYALPADTAAVANTPIASAKYNQLTEDLAADLNLPRPVTVGGTGGESASEARENLGIDAAVAFATKGANYTALATDNNAIHRFSAAATLSLTAAATLGTGWHYTVIADGGAVTIDPNGAELVNGAATQIIPDGFTATIICDGSAFRTTSINSVLADLADIGVSLAAGHLYGFTLSNSVADAANDIDIAVGSCLDSTNAKFIELTGALTKRLDANWAVGTNQGGLDTGSASGVNTYHVHAIFNPTTSTVDILFSLSPTAPTLPTDYTYFRRIGAVIRGLASIRAFSQRGDEFLIDDPQLDIGVSNQGTSAVSRGLPVPTGIQVDALLRVRGSNASGWVLLVSPLDVTDTAPSISSAPLQDIGGTAGVADRATLRVRTNTSGQVRTRSSIASTELQISTFGWIDTRGK